MNTQSLLRVCLFAVLVAAACSGGASIDPVLVATPLGNAAYDMLFKAAAKEMPLQCLRLGESDVAFIRGGQPIVIRHKFDEALDPAQQRLTADLVLETVCERRTVEDVAYAADNELIKPLLAPPGSECGLIITLRVADAESRCEILADAESCGEAVMPCAAESEGSSSSGASSGGSSGSEGSSEGGGGTTATTG